jgi:hypothetical protein
MNKAFWVVVLTVLPGSSLPAQDQPCTRDPRIRTRGVVE